MARLAIEQAFPWPHCWFHELTGWDCPLCGGTRCLAALSHGDILGALGYNPAICLACFAGVAWMVFSQCVSRTTWNHVCKCLHGHRDQVGQTLAVLLVLNWVFLLCRMR